RMRPPTPVPSTVPRSTPVSVASLRTSGVTYDEPDESGFAADAAGTGAGAEAGAGAETAVTAGADCTGAAGSAGAAGCSTGAGSAGGAAAATGADSAAGAGTGAGAGSGAAGASAAGAAGAAPPPVPSPTIASGLPTSTVSSSCTRICSSTPAMGEGISVSTLSVETSTRGSSTSTWSPTCFSHRVTVPSVTLSPSAGRLTGSLIVYCSL